MTTLRFTQLANFRVSLIERLADLCLAGELREWGSRSSGQLADRLIAVLARPGYLERHDLLEAPVGIGDGSWWAHTSRLGRQVLGELERRERRALHLAVGAAVRTAVFEGRTYEGSLHGRSLRRSELGWSAEEAVAFARRFCVRKEWNDELGPIVVLEEPGPDHGQRWGEVEQALARRELRFGQLRRYRQLRAAYDRYVLLPMWRLLRAPTQDAGRILPFPAPQRPAPTAWASEVAA